MQKGAANRGQEAESGRNDYDAPLIPRLADFVVNHGQAGLAQESRTYFRLLLLDFLGVGLYGAQWKGFSRLHDTFLGVTSQGESTSLTGGRFAAPHAAYLNGLAVHGTDWDDSHLSAIVHPGVAVLSAALAVAERVGASVEQLAEAAVVGYEIAIRLGQAIQPGHMYQGFHGTATCGVFGSAAASARLLGLDVGHTIHALGMAASSASGLTQCILSGSSAKAFQAGKCAHDGVMAALLAEAGLDAPLESIEGERGFFRAYAAGVAPRDVFQDLGLRDSVLDVMVKRFPIAAHMHGAIDAAIALAPTLAGRLEQIDRIAVTIDPAIARNNSNPNPKDDQAARMSLPFCVACALWLNARSKESEGLCPKALERGLAESQVRTMAQKIDCLPWPDSASNGTGTSMRSRVAVTIAGVDFLEEADPTWGATAKDTRNQVETKFHRLTTGLLTAEQQSRLLLSALDLDGDEAVATLLGKAMPSISPETQTLERI